MDNETGQGCQRVIPLEYLEGLNEEERAALLRFVQVVIDENLRRERPDLLPVYQLDAMRR